MNNYTIFIIFGGLFILYLIILMTNRSKSKSRKSRKFMGDYKRDDKKE